MKCSKCGFPDTRTGLIFVDGKCGACINFEDRVNIDWAERKGSLAAICGMYRKEGGYDCLIPVSGGKDSYFLVHTMVKEMGMHPLLVTVTDSFEHTKAGIHNLRNLITKFNLNHWQYTISHDLFVRATRAAFEGTGEALAFVEWAIYTIPTMLAQKLGIGLVVYGENSAYQYGTSTDDEAYANRQLEKMVENIECSRAWWNSKGITSAEVDSILPEVPIKPKVLFMSHFFPWSSVTNLEVAQRYGFKTLEGEWDRKGTCENFEQIDSRAYMLHLWLKYPKFGFQRVTDIATRRLREGLMTREECDKAIAEHDHELDPIALKDFCQTLGYTKREFVKIVKTFNKAKIRFRKPRSTKKEL